MARDPLGGGGSGGALSPGWRGWRSRGRAPLGRKEAGAAGRSTTPRARPFNPSQPTHAGTAPPSSRPRIGLPRLGTPLGSPRLRWPAPETALKGTAPNSPTPSALSQERGLGPGDRALLGVRTNGGFAGEKLSGVVGETRSCSPRPGVRALP